MNQPAGPDQVKMNPAMPSPTQDAASPPPDAEARADEVRAIVRDHYGEVARRGAAAGCAPASACAPGCCVPGAPTSSGHLGYDAAEAALAPDGADLGLGCGNPTAMASIRTGETVLDLGSGAGFDCFIASHQVGPTGQVIGVDMTPDMVSRARANARKVGAGNVDFRLGEIEHLPVADASVDVILSNCVINLSPDKAAVFPEAHRVLRPGGRLAVSDMMTRGQFTPEERANLSAWAGCVTGAEDVALYAGVMRAAGFVDISIVDKGEPAVELGVAAFGDGGEGRGLAGRGVEADHQPVVAGAATGQRRRGGDRGQQGGAGAAPRAAPSSLRCSHQR